jgi:pilus assembly protein CpaB
VVTETQVIEEKRTQILVALAPIGVGERLSPETVAWQDWPEGAVRPEYISIGANPDALDQLTGAVARFEIFPGEPLMDQKLVRSEQGYLSAVLDTGRRGISIVVSAASASGGFIVPNDHVDVILTRSSCTGLISETILENVKVLAIGARLGETGGTGGPADPDNPRAEMFADSAIATLDLDPVEGETVINASRVGTLSLALRSIVDFDEDPADVRRRPSQQAVRMIKGGNQTNVMAGATTDPGVPPAQVDAAAYEVSVDGEFAPQGVSPAELPSAEPAGPGQ